MILFLLCDWYGESPRFVADTRAGDIPNYLEPGGLSVRSTLLLPISATELIFDILLFIGWWRPPPAKSSPPFIRTIAMLSLGTDTLWVAFRVWVISPQHQGLHGLSRGAQPYYVADRRERRSSGTMATRSFV